MQIKTFTKKTVDNSDKSSFSFSFFCDICGMEWKSPVKSFSGGNCSAVTNDEALKLLWADEHRTAFNEAKLEAHVHFSNCVKCSGWVCDECFLPERLVCKKCR